MSMPNEFLEYTEQDNRNKSNMLKQDVSHLISNLETLFKLK